MSLITLFRPDQRATTARIRTSACRGYVVELDPKNGESPRMLENLAGKVVHFRSLDLVRDELRSRGVRYADLHQQHACEELSAGGVSTKAECGVPVLVESNT